MHDDNYLCCFICNKVVYYRYNNYTLEFWLIISKLLYYMRDDNYLVDTLHGRSITRIFQFFSLVCITCSLQLFGQSNFEKSTKNSKSHLNLFEIYYRSSMINSSSSLGPELSGWLVKWTLIPNTGLAESG